MFANKLIYLLVFAPASYVCPGVETITICYDGKPKQLNTVSERARSVDGFKNDFECTYVLKMIQ